MKIIYWISCFLFWEKFASTIGGILIKVEQNRSPAWVRVAVQACWRSKRNRSTGCAVRSTPDAHVVQYSATKWPKQQTAIIYHILWLRCGNKIANKRHNSFDSATESECECECERAAAAEAAPGARYTAEAWVCFAYIRGCATCIPRTQTQRHYTALPCSVVVLSVCACVRLSLGGWIGTACVGRAPQL